MHIFAKIANFGFDARSAAAVNVEHSNLYRSVFKPIRILLKVLQKKFGEKNVFLTHPSAYQSRIAYLWVCGLNFRI